MGISSALGSSALLPAGLGFRNKIINGDMRINQRGAASYTGSGSQIYTLDRFWFYASSGTITVGQSTSVVPNGFGSSLVVNVTTGGNYSSGGNYCLLGQTIEATQMQDFAWGTTAGKPMMVSFWVRSSVTGMYTFAMQNQPQNSVYVATYNINVANTWEYKTVQIPAPPSGTTWPVTGTASGALIGFALGTDTNFHASSANTWGTVNAYGVAAATDVAATTGATWYLTGLQIEQNYQPTPFEQRPIGVELALCQRYYQNSFNIGNVPGTSTSTLDAIHVLSWGDGNAAGFPFQVPMRAAPSVTLRAQGSTTAGQVSSGGGDRAASATNIGAKQVSYIAITSGQASTYVRFTWEAAAEL